jgi:hypothetical protein
MLVPGVIFSSGRVDITAGAGQTPDFINQGFGFMSDGSLAVDISAPSGDFYYKGFRMSSVGAVYGTVSTDPSDVYHEGIRRTTEGLLVMEVADPIAFSSGNPVTANFAFAVDEGGAPSTDFDGLVPTVIVDNAEDLTVELAAAAPGTIIGLEPGVYDNSLIQTPYESDTPGWQPAAGGTFANPIIIVGRHNPVLMADPLTDALRSELISGSGAYGGANSHPVFGSDGLDYIQWRQIVCDEANCTTRADNGPC